MAEGLVTLYAAGFSNSRSKPHLNIVVPNAGNRLCVMVCMVDERGWRISTSKRKTVLAEITAES